MKNSFDIRVLGFSKPKESKTRYTHRKEGYKAIFQEQFRCKICSRSSDVVYGGGESGYYCIRHIKDIPTGRVRKFWEKYDIRNG